MDHLECDNHSDLNEGDWVEVVDDVIILHGESGHLLQVDKIDRGNKTLTLKMSNEIQLISYDEHTTTHPLLRRWDQHENEKTAFQDGAIPITESTLLDLEHGIQIKFTPSTGSDKPYYRTGDYWLIPARTATGDVEWPKEKDKDSKLIAKSMPPHGITHHYAPLAIVVLGNDQPNDVRSQFSWLAQ